MKKGLNIEVTSGQYEFLYDLVMMAYELDVPEQKGWDIQTYDNLVDNVCNAKETYLSEGVRGIWNHFQQNTFLTWMNLQQYNDIWFNNMLNMLTEKGQLYVPILNKSFNKLGEEIENSMAFDQHYFTFKEDIE